MIRLELVIFFSLLLLFSFNADSQQQRKFTVLGGTSGSSLLYNRDSIKVTENGSTFISLIKGVNQVKNKKDGYLTSVFPVSVSNVGAARVNLEELIQVPDFRGTPNRLFLNKITGLDYWYIMRHENMGTYRLNKPKYEGEEICTYASRNSLKLGLSDFLRTNEILLSSENGFTVNENVLNINVDLKKLYKVIVKGEFIQVNADLSIEILDLRLNSLIERTISVKGNISTLDLFEKEIVDCLVKGVCMFLNDLEVQNILNGSHNTEKNSSYDQLNLISSSIVKDHIEARKSVVTVLTESGHGSGCQISKDGYVLSNYHVVKGADSIRVVLFSGDTIDGSVLRMDPLSDLALIKVDREFKHSFKISEETFLAQDVFAIGSPLTSELSQSISSGILSSRVDINSITYLQFDARINGGNSGGGLVNRKGELIGIVNAKAVSINIEGISFAIPIVESVKSFNLHFEN
jgi:hypothetical protein